MMENNVDLINLFIILVGLHILVYSTKLFKTRFFTILKNSSNNLLEAALNKQHLKLENMKSSYEEMKTLNDLYPNLMKNIFIFLYIFKLTHLLLIIALGISILININ